MWLCGYGVLRAGRVWSVWRVERTPYRGQVTCVISRDPVALCGSATVSKGSKISKVPNAWRRRRGRPVGRDAALHTTCCRLLHCSHGGPTWLVAETCILLVLAGSGFDGRSRLPSPIFPVASHQCLWTGCRCNCGCHRLLCPGLAGLSLWVFVGWNVAIFV